MVENVELRSIKPKEQQKRYLPHISGLDAGFRLIQNRRVKGFNALALKGLLQDFPQWWVAGKSRPADICLSVQAFLALGHKRLVRSGRANIHSM